MTQVCKREKHFRERGSVSTKAWRQVQKLMGEKVKVQRPEDTQVLKGKQAD
jgi:hypothetical protein